MQLRAVTFDVGGVIFSDEVFKGAIFNAIEHFAGEIDSARFEKVYQSHLQSHAGSLRSKLCMEFFGNLELKGQVMELATQNWNFTTKDFYADSRECLTELKANGLKIGLAANQPASVVGALKENGIWELIDFAGISALVGIEKPDPALFELVLNKLGEPAANCAHVGNRLDTDVWPAQKVGMKTVWVLRGEANPNPSPADLATPDLVVKDLSTVAQFLTSL